MARYLVWRLLQALVSVVGVLTIVFVIMRLSGDPTLLLVPEGATRDQVDELRHLLGFDRSILIQYLDFIAGLFRADFGNSVVQRIPAVDIVASRLPYTFVLAGGALVLAIGVGVPVGVLMAVWQGRPVERLLAAIVVSGQSMPTFLSGILLILVFAVMLGWLPASGVGSASSLVMPSSW